MLDRLTHHSRRQLEARRQRDRAYRARLRASEFIAFLPVNAAVLDRLIRLDWLDERDAADRHKVGIAAARMIQSIESDGKS